MHNREVAEGRGLSPERNRKPSRYLAPTLTV